MVGLNLSDNTSDILKPISNPTQNALNLKAPILNPTFQGNVQGITKSMVSLGLCDNTSDLAKPISTDTQNALDLKVSTTGDQTISGTKTFSGTPRLNQGFKLTDELSFEHTSNVNQNSITFESHGTKLYRQCIFKNFSLFSVQGSSFFVGATSIIGNQTIAGDCSIQTFAGQSGGNLSVSGTSTLTGNVTTGNDVSVGGDCTVTGDLSVNGNILGDTTYTGKQYIRSTEVLPNGSTVLQVRPICNVQHMLFNTTANNPSGILTWNVNFGAEYQNAVTQSIFPYQFKIYGISLNIDNDGVSGTYNFQFEQRYLVSDAYANTGTQASIVVSTNNDTSYLHIWAENDRPTIQQGYQVKCSFTTSNVSSTTNFREFNLTLHGYQF